MFDGTAKCVRKCDWSKVSSEASINSEALDSNDSYQVNVRQLRRFALQSDTIRSQLSKSTISAHLLDVYLTGCAGVLPPLSQNLRLDL